MGVRIENVLREVLDSTPRRTQSVVAAEVLRRVDVQYWLGVRLLDVAPVTGMVNHNTLRWYSSSRLNGGRR